MSGFESFHQQFVAYVNLYMNPALASVESSGFWSVAKILSQQGLNMSAERIQDLHATDDIEESENRFLLNPPLVL